MSILSSKPVKSVVPVKSQQLNSTLLMEKFVNLLMFAGKKNVAYAIFCAAGNEFLLKIKKAEKKAQPEQHRYLAGQKNQKQFFDGKDKTQIKKRLIQKHEQKSKLLLQLHVIIDNIRPSVEGKKCRVAGSTKLIPAIVPYDRSCSLAIRWIIESALKKKKTSRMSMSQCLAQEFLDAQQKTGRPRQRRDQLHKTCEGNRSFLRYKWW